MRWIVALKQTLARKVGPFPVIVWVGIVGAGVVVAVVIRKRTQSISEEPQREEAPGSTDTVGLPYDADPASMPYGVGPPVYAPGFGIGSGQDSLAPGGGVGDGQRLTITIIDDTKLPPKLAAKPTMTAAQRAAAMKKYRAQLAKKYPKYTTKQLTDLVRKRFPIPKPLPSPRAARSLLTFKQNGTPLTPTTSTAPAR
jgi:hypothetical protein